MAPSPIRYGKRAAWLTDLLDGAHPTTLRTWQGALPAIDRNSIDGWLLLANDK